ncbi:membrane protein [Jannaschia pagri]|uniref:Membrane protein n=1 Tax=Jannaschia pagri TaxID=2829797 RepID=A0ABQ4NGT4_9RHOB|nr:MULTISPECIES: DMT family transporter [unclassified Jannaschia]GIT90258.1 membrane protein [Jannaschia sp. AI_61]GIT93636.1 membrane protein [Jannaschia sp. AI_62]
MTENLRGALFMMASMATFTLNDACIKLLAQGLPTFQAVFLRGLGATALLIALAHITGALRQPIPRADRPYVVARALAEVAAFLPFIIALTHMPLADITAVLQALPLTITAAGAFFLGERVGWRRWTAIAVGLLGVLLIVRPGAAGFDHWSLLAVLTVLIITARDLITRRLSPEVPSLKVAILTAAGVMVLGLVLSLFEPWQMPTAGQGGLTALAALFIIGGYLFSVMAMRVGAIAVVTPFRYTAMIWGLLLGLFVFGDWPDGLTLLGAGLVVATGLYTLWRETRATAS